MHRLFVVHILLIALISSFTTLNAQSTDQLIDELQAIHTALKIKPCIDQQNISNRAMNLFLSDRIGSYLTDHKSLSFYKNYITLDATSGVFSLNHNMFQAKGTDELVRSFYVVGVKANAGNAFASAVTNKSFTNELGVTIKKTWIGKPRTVLNNCFEKNVMDVKRALLLDEVQREIKKREADFASSLFSLKQDSISDADFSKATELSRQSFYTRLGDEFSRKFAYLQYQELKESLYYKRITTHWTDVNIYLPIILQRFVVAESLSVLSENKRAYPFELSLNHTRFWETKKSGTVFLGLEAGLHLNNSIETNSLESMDFNHYESSGGADTQHLHQRKINTIYIGSYQAFVTPFAKFSFVYYPPNSHIGLSTKFEQNIGIYKASNWTIGVPVVLIDKKGAPASNFEFQIRYFDVFNTESSSGNFTDKISVGLTVGVPFSKIIY